MGVQGYCWWHLPFFLLLPHLLLLIDLSPGYELCFLSSHTRQFCSWILAIVTFALLDA